MFHEALKRYGHNKEVFYHYASVTLMMLVGVALIRVEEHSNIKLGIMLYLVSYIVNKPLPPPPPNLCSDPITV